MRTGFAATRFGWSAFVVPFLFVFSPSLLLEGDILTLVHHLNRPLTRWMALPRKWRQKWLFTPIDPY
jgi:TRAP-type uncharacterized transport system fused permease subunit